MLTQTAAEVHAIAARHHDIQQKQRRPRTFSILHDGSNGRIRLSNKARTLQLILHQSANVSIVFQDEDSLAHTFSSAAVNAPRSPLSLSCRRPLNYYRMINLGELFGKFALKRMLIM